MHNHGLLIADHFLHFDELERRSLRVTSGLDALGVGPGDCVAILMRNDAPFLEVTYGVMRLGAYAVPINWHFKGEEISYILNDCGAKALFAHTDLLNDAAQDLPDSIPQFHVPVPASISATYGIKAKYDLPHSRPYTHWRDSFTEYKGPIRPAPMSMIYTSGTTGHPKGVRRFAPTPEITTKLDKLRADIYGLKPHIRAALPGPLYHSAPNSFGLRAGKIGDLLVLMEKFDPEALLALIEKERIDTIFMVPTMFIRLLKLPEDVRKKYDVSSLQHIIHAAAPCPPDVKKAMIEWWGPVIYEFYGGTESGPVTFANSADALKKTGTVGRASPGAELRILDENDQPLPVGKIGEIYSRIDAYPDFTYHNNPQKRAEIERDGFITCGDVGYIDDEGYVFICDRKRDMVISGGVNIYPAEIENVLHAMPGVHDCAVFGIPDGEFGESLMAYVEPHHNFLLETTEVRAYLEKHLANYKVPRGIKIAHNLPREDSGKIFKRKLREPYWQNTGRAI